VNVVVIAALIFGVGFHWLSLTAAFGLATLGQWLLVEAAKIALRAVWRLAVVIRHGGRPRT